MYLIKSILTAVCRSSGDDLNPQSFQNNCWRWQPEPVDELTQGTQRKEVTAVFNGTLAEKLKQE